jgi:hypothetical protein
MENPVGGEAIGAAGGIAIAPTGLHRHHGIDAEGEADGTDRDGDGCGTHQPFIAQFRVVVGPILESALDESGVAVEINRRALEIVERRGIAVESVERVFGVRCSRAAEGHAAGAGAVAEEAGGVSGAGGRDRGSDHKWEKQWAVHRLNA